MMKSFTSLLLTTLAGVQTVLAQDAVLYTDKASGIVFNTWAPTTRLTFGLALPSNALTTDATEFIGMITCQGKGWCGMSMGGGMNENLLILAYPQDGAVLTSLRWAENYQLPAVYKGDAKLTQVSSTVNSTHHSIIFRCQNCFKWQQGTSEVGKVSTSEGYLVLGWCFASSAPTGGSCPNTLTVRQHDSQGLFAAPLNDAVVHSQYSTWAAKATKEVAGNCAGTRPTAVPTVTTRVVTLKPPTAVPTPPPAKKCTKTYKVVAGDYCYKIATDNGLTLDQFYAINPTVNCNPLQIGVVVCVKQK